MIVKLNGKVYEFISLFRSIVNTIFTQFSVLYFSVYGSSFYLGREMEQTSKKRKNLMIAVIKFFLKQQVMVSNATCARSFGNIPFRFHGMPNMFPTSEDSAVSYFYLEILWSSSANQVDQQ